jgi:hypothetical protein
VARPVEIDRERLERAWRRELTRRNTQPGTPERQAVDRVAYLRRLERNLGLTARQAAGHPKPDDRLPSISLMVEAPPRFLVVEGLSRADTRRAARYEGLVGQLRDGKITPATFERRVSSWRPIAGYRFLSDPYAVLAILEERRAQDQEIFVYDSGRAP